MSAFLPSFFSLSKFLTRLVWWCNNMDESPFLPITLIYILWCGIFLFFFFLFSPYSIWYMHCSMFNVQCSVCSVLILSSRFLFFPFLSNSFFFICHRTRFTMTAISHKQYKLNFLLFQIYKYFILFNDILFL